MRLRIIRRMHVGLRLAPGGMRLVHAHSASAGTSSSPGDFTPRLPARRPAQALQPGPATPDPFKPRPPLHGPPSCSSPPPAEPPGARSRHAPGFAAALSGRCEVILRWRIVGRGGRSALRADAFRIGTEAA